ncbi:hypothetical protein [Stackebrandtia nassauensis]|uniref:Uncharacterized protein n=1 Tax=Stackebrandtia nassauensis (strain DSM 44728 / CIP 108903 / NRRL B-16338 / NBRC 102104 / LLR-40K-21) TaxID=446470 RepID=D3PVB0_STANL|nr:hypothetical protein [Stackebrandtia nassauensis]ADD41163.1 hypothetical protein Snas_1459 [Stackebrandtia nassauensis DSM 44728]
MTNDKQPHKFAPWKSLLLLTASGIGVTYAATDINFESLNEIARLVFRGAAAIIGAGLLVLYTYMRHTRPLKAPPPKKEVPPLPANIAMRIQRTAGISAQSNGPTTVSLSQAKIFAFSVVNPAESRQRICERYETGQRGVRKTVTVNVKIPSSQIRDLRKEKSTKNGDVTVLFPVLFPKKGELLDNFKPLGASEKETTDLSYSEYIGLIALVLRILMLHALDASEKDLWKVDPDAARAEIAALTEISQRKSQPSSYVNSAAHDIEQLKVKDDKIWLRNLIAEVVYLLTSHYAIVIPAQVQADGRFTIGYERTIIPTLDLQGGAKGFRGRIAGRGRILLGARPVAISLPIEHACTAQSYHMIVHSEEGLYLGSQDSPDLAPYIESYLENPRPDTMAPPYYRFRSRLGQSYAHFYTRYFPQPRENARRSQPADPKPKPLEFPLVVKFKFYEVPPGTIFRASITAIAAAALIWLIGFVTVWADRRGVEISTNGPAILLVFPAAAAGWLGFDRPSRRLLEGTMVSRLSLIFTALISILSSGLFIVFQGGAVHWDIPSGGDVLGISNWLWGGLVLLAIFNAVGTSLTCLVKTHEFIYLSTRKSPDGGATQDS